MQRRINVFLNKFKSGIEQDMMYKMNRYTLYKLNNNKFSMPRNSMLKQVKNVNEKVEVVSSVSTAEQNNLNNNENFNLNNCNFENLNIAGYNLSEDKKLENVLKMLLNFQENCVKNNSWNKFELEILHQNCQQIMCCLLPKFDVLRYQHTEQIVLSVLLFAISKAKLQKKTFIKQASQILSKKKTKLSAIKKSRCFKHVSSILDST